MHRVALLPIPANGDFTAGLAETVWDVMKSTIVKTDGFDVLDRNVMNAVLGEKRCSLKPFAKDCFMEAGKALKVDTLITGKIVSYNNLYYLSFLRINSATGKVENSADDECPQAVLTDFAKQIATRLTRKFYFLEPDPRPDWRNPAEVNAFFQKVLQSPGKDEWQKPGTVVNSLPLEQGDIIAEIGAGTGYFTGWLSKRTGKTGTVYAVDIDKEMLEQIERKAKKEGLTNVKTVLASKDDPSLPPDSVDLVFLCDVFTDIYNGSDKQGYLKKLKDLLKKNGMVAVVDYHVPMNIPLVFSAINYGVPEIKSGEKESLPSIAFMLSISHFKDSAVKAGIPFAFRVPKGKVIDQFIKAGYRLHKEYGFLPYQYFLVFAKQ